ncbi:MAG TPA: DNA polymerase/3'-5' exonuclease PolX [Caldilineaceae bacterium]|nr:DNA polymerase/3'-5' exonuclease PolX [Caldilineaceae bacterium]
MASDAPAAQTHLRITNSEVADTLTLMANILQILDANRFRIIAFQNAAEAVRELSQPIQSLHAEGKLRGIQGVGPGIAGLISELLEQGSVAEIEELKAKVPPGVVEMMQVPDMGPKKARRLWEELNITSVEELKAAGEAGKLRTLKGFGEKSEQKILKGIELLNRRGDSRKPIGAVRPIAMELIAGLRAALPEGVLQRIEATGSLRRWRETIGDVDLLAVSDQPTLVIETFDKLPVVDQVLGAGDTKTSVLLGNGLQVDLRVVEAKNWGAALQYFTGNKEHNIEIREIALRKGWSLNEYCLTATGAGEAPAGEERFFDEEADLYHFLGLDWMPPQMRENRGEIVAARNHTLPNLITLADIRGELHGHSTWSDGTAPIAAMAEVARQRGYQFWGVCDHSVGLGMVNGLDVERLHQQAAEIAALNEGWASQGIDFRLLRGSEVEILADGTLGLPDEALAELDVVVASIHSALRQERDTITARCLKAISNPHVDILGHPTGRMIGARPPADLDMEQVLRACAEHGVAVEINAHPSRLDVNDVYARRAVELGCKLSINGDAHELAGMEVMEYGIAVARRAWLTPANVINTYTLSELMTYLKRP